MKTKYFQKQVNISHCKDMWNFLNSHFKYYTLSSWNRLQSVANDVKVYNLPFKNNHWKVLETLEEDDYITINTMLKDWEESHPGFSLGFNGKSGGYLVIYNKSDNCSILPDSIFDWDSYEDFKEYAYGDITTYYKNELRYYTDVVMSFDKLCDEIIDVCDRMTTKKLNETKQEEESLMERDVRKNTNTLLEMIDEGLLDPKSVVNACLTYMSEDEVTDMAVSNELLSSSDIKD